MAVRLEVREDQIEVERYEPKTARGEKALMTTLMMETKGSCGANGDTVPSKP